MVSHHDVNMNFTKIIWKYIKDVSQLSTDEISLTFIQRVSCS